MSDDQTFSPIDADKWQRIKDSVAKQAGITIGSDSGEAEKHGVTLSWAYTAATADDPGSLEIKLVGRAWYDPSAATIDAQPKTWIDGA